jgi:hypothetical protein
MPYIVTTLRGSAESASHVSVSLFEAPGDAKNFCQVINRLKINDGEWVNANIKEMNKIYSIKKPIPMTPMAFEEFKKLDDRIIQRVLQEIDSHELAIVMQKKDNEFAEKIFRNMSKRAVQMIKEDIEFMGAVDEESIQPILDKMLVIAKSNYNYESVNNIYDLRTEKYFEKFAKIPKNYYVDKSGPRDGVLVMYGQDENVEGISVSCFYGTAINYANFLNGLKLKGGCWMHARCFEENQEHEIKKQNSPVLASFNQLLNLRDFILGITLQEFSTYDIAIALKFANDSIKEKVFTNMPPDTVKMLKKLAKEIEETPYIDMSYVNHAQRKILKKALKMNSDPKYGGAEMLKD